MHTEVVLAGLLLSARLPVNDVLDRIPDDRNRHARGAADASVVLWPGCAVPFLVVESDGCSFATSVCNNAADSATAALIRRSISVASDELQRRTTCRFYEDPADPAAVLVTAEHQKCYVNHIGKITQGRNVMNIGREWCSNDEGAVKHELLHVLGVEHEHQNPRSDSMLTRCAETQCNPNSLNCRIDTDVVEWKLTSYDPWSIMHYELNAACDLALTAAGSAAAARAGISSLQIGLVDNISNQDAAFLRSLYGIGPARSPSPPGPSAPESGISDGTLVAIAVGGVAVLGIVIFGVASLSSTTPKYKPVPQSRF